MILSPIWGPNTTLVAILVPASTARTRRAGAPTRRRGPRRRGAGPPRRSEARRARGTEPSWSRSHASASERSLCRLRWPDRHHRPLGPDGAPTPRRLDLDEDERRVRRARSGRSRRARPRSARCAPRCASRAARGHRRPAPPRRAPGAGGPRHRPTVGGQRTPGAQSSKRATMIDIGAPRARRPPLASARARRRPHVRAPRRRGAGGPGRGPRRPRAAQLLAGRACPTPAVRESRERVRAALVNSGFKFPQQRITANLAPADLRKAGPGFDLAIAAALLAASASSRRSGSTASPSPASSRSTARSGRSPGALAMAEAARRAGLEAIAVPAAERARGDARRRRRGSIPLARLEQLALSGHRARAAASAAARPGARTAPGRDPRPGGPEGAALPAYALEVAAAGGHSVLIIGPPGAGKSLAARRLPSILPPLSRSEALEVLRIASACGRPRGSTPPATRPFRAPHHTISTAGLVGGGSPPRRRGGDAGPPRGPVPRRAGGVLARGARGAATAARGGRG